MQPTVIDLLSLQSRIIAVPPFVRSVVTLRVCSESLANGVLGEIQREVDKVDWQNLRVTELASDESGTSDPGRRNFSTPNCYGNGYVPKTAEEIALDEAMKRLHGSSHFQFCLGMLDNYASMLNPNAVRSTVAVLMSQKPIPQQYHTDGSGSFQQWSRGVYGHCFFAVLSIGRGMQTLNLIIDNDARQLQLPPGVACFVGPDAVHGGSSTSGFRIHCGYDIKGLDAFDSSHNVWLSHPGQWPDWKSDSELKRVAWHAEALLVHSVHTPFLAGSIQK